MRDLPEPGVIRASCLLERDWDMRTQTGVHWRLPQWVSSCRGNSTITEQCLHIWSFERFVELFFFSCLHWIDLRYTWDASVTIFNAHDNGTRDWWGACVMKSHSLLRKKKIEVISVHKFLRSLISFAVIVNESIQPPISHLEPAWASGSILWHSKRRIIIHSREPSVENLLNSSHPDLYSPCCI